MLKCRVAIPLHDMAGKLIGYRGRGENPDRSKQLESLPHIPVRHCGATGVAGSGALLPL